MFLPIEELEKLITSLRTDMIEKGIIFGFNSEVTIVASQKLDSIIFHYQVLNRKKIS
jgi:hypothetical protein